MAVGNYSGISKVEYATAGTSFASPIDLGTPLASSAGTKSDPQGEETGKGTNVYAGVKKEHVFEITDMSKFAGLETIMKADTEVDVRITDVASGVETVSLNASVKVSKNYGATVGKRNVFQVTFTSFEV